MGNWCFMRSSDVRWRREGEQVDPDMWPRCERRGDWRWERVGGSGNAQGPEHRVRRTAGLEGYTIGARGGGVWASGNCRRKARLGIYIPSLTSHSCSEEMAWYAQNGGGRQVDRSFAITPENSECRLAPPCTRHSSCRLANSAFPAISSDLLVCASRAL